MSQEAKSSSYKGCIGKYMFIVDKYYRQFLRNSLKPYGMTSSEAMVMLVLYQEYLLHGQESACTQDKLNEELHYDKAALTRTMQLLEKRQFVTRSNHQHDKRSFVFTITAAGVEFMPTIIDTLRQWDQILFSGVSLKQREVFEEIFVKVAVNAGEGAKLQLET